MVNRTGLEVGVAYFRAGYTPKDYPTDQVTYINSRYKLSIKKRYLTRTLELSLEDEKWF